jgi:hypothetical protein
MILKAHFYLLNDDFSPEYADANHGGQPSENNPMFEWEDEFEVSDLSKIELIRKGKMPLVGLLPNDEPFESEVNNMFLVALQMENGAQGFMGVSESILERFELDENADESILHVYIKDYEPLSNPLPGVFIASKEFPKELIF